jgi:hypothetical protein
MAQVVVLILSPVGKPGVDKQLVTVPVTVGVCVVIADPFVKVNGEPVYVKLDGAATLIVILILVSVLPLPLLAVIV